ARRSAEGARGGARQGARPGRAGAQGAGSKGGNARTAGHHEDPRTGGRVMRRLIIGAAFAGAVAICAPAFAEGEHEEHPAAQEEHKAEGEHHAAEGEHHAEHHEEHGIQNWWSWDFGPNAKDPSHKHLPPPFGYALVNFGIFLAILSKLLFKPIAQMTRDRH